MQKQKFSPYLIFISILTFLTIFILIIQKGYSNLTEPIKKVESNILLKPINPSLDLSAVKQIENREEYEFIESPIASISSPSTQNE